MLVNQYTALFLILLSLPLSGCQSSTNKDSYLPKPGTVEAKELCEHFAGEEPYDAERAAEINHALNKLECKFD